MSMELDAALLVLVEGHLDAYRLIATWPRVGKAVDDPDEMRMPEPEGDEVITPRDGNPLLAWAKASGIDWEVAARWVPILFDNRLLGPNGIVDPAVHNIVRAYGTRMIRRAT